MVTVNVNDAMRNVTLKVDVRGVNQLVWRLRLGRWLIRLAGIVIGCDVEEV